MDADAEAISVYGIIPARNCKARESIWLPRPRVQSKNMETQQIKIKALTLKEREEDGGRQEVTA